MSDAAQVVLSSLVRFQRHRDNYLPQVSETDFEDSTSRKLFRVIKQMAETGSPITRDSLMTYFRGDAVASIQLSLLYDNTIPEVDDGSFGSFKSTGVRSRLRLMSEYINKQTRLGTVPTATILAEVQGMMDRIEGNTVMGLIEPSAAVESAIEKLRRWASDEEVPVQFGIPEVDEKLFLNRLEGFVVVAAPPSLGKTTLVSRVLRANVLRGVPSLFFTLEMSAEDIYLKLAQGEVEMQGLELNTRTIRSDADRNRIEKAILRYRDLPLYIYDGIRDFAVMSAISRKMSVTRGVKLTAMDYIQLGQTSNPGDTDVVRVSKGSETLKLLSQADQSKGYPAQTVIALSQYNAEGQNSQSNRGGQIVQQDAASQRRRLTGATMRWSGQVRQDADIIIHLYTEDDIDNPRPKINLFFDKYRHWRRGWEVETVFMKDRQIFVTEQSVIEESIDSKTRLISL
jgi:replicative DNA helicase